MQFGADHDLCEFSSSPKLQRVQYFGLDLTVCFFLQRKLQPQRAASEDVEDYSYYLIVFFNLFELFCVF